MLSVNKIELGRATRGSLPFPNRGSPPARRRAFGYVVVGMPGASEHLAVAQVAQRCIGFRLPGVIPEMLPAVRERPQSRDKLLALSALNPHHSTVHPAALKPEIHAQRKAAEQAGLSLHPLFGHEHEQGRHMRCAAAGRRQVHGHLPVSAARAAWEAERRRLADEFRPHKDRPTELDAWVKYSAGTKAAWRAFFAAAPDEADRLFAETMFAVSEASTGYSRISR